MIESKLIGNGKWYYWISQQMEAANTRQETGIDAIGLEKIKTNSGGFGRFFGFGLSSINSEGSSFIDGGLIDCAGCWYWNAASVRWGSGIPTSCGVLIEGFDSCNQGNGESNHNRFWAR